VVWGLDKVFSGENWGGEGVGKRLSLAQNDGSNGNNNGQLQVRFVVEKVRAVWVMFKVSGSFASLRMTAMAGNGNSNSKSNGHDKNKCGGSSLRSE
jgi:hypothetical protein